MRWKGVELRHLVTLRAVAETGSLAAAARRLGYSQPAVSQQLATLEQLVEARLVARRPGGREVALTEAGRLTLGHATAILARAQAADADLRALRDGARGSLRLGTIPSVGARIVPSLLRRFTAAYPSVTVELTEDASDARLLDRLEAAEVDHAVAMLPLREGPFAATDLLDDPYVALVAADSPAAATGRPLRPRQIAKLPLIAIAQGHAHETYLRAHGLTAQIRFVTEDNETLVGLVAAGLGAAIVPRLIVDPGRTDVTRLELSPILPPRRVGMAWHRDREQTEAGRALVELACEVAAEIYAAC